MPTSFVCDIHIGPGLDKRAAALRLAHCFGVLKAHGLAPLAHAEAAWRSASPRILGGTLIHAEFARQTGNPLWGASFMFLPAPRAEATVISMTTPAQPSKEPANAWVWLTGLAEVLADGIHAEFALIGGFRAGRGHDDGVGGTPLGPEVAPGHPPQVLCPWMYWGPDRIVGDGILSGLRMLGQAAFRSSASPVGGWILQAYRDYSAAEPQSLIATYAAAFKILPPEWLAVP